MNTMISYFLYVFAAILLLQQAKGEGIHDQLMLYVSPELEPLQDVTRKLESTLADLEIKKQELELHKKQLEEKLAKIPKEHQNDNLKLHFSFFNNWDLDSCVSLTDDWKIGADLAMRGAVVVLHITETVGHIGNNILNCPSRPFLQILPCYNSNLLDLKDQIVIFRRRTMPFIHNALVITKHMREDFDKCVGIPYTVKDKIERHLQNLRY